MLVRLFAALLAGVANASAAEAAPPPDAHGAPVAQAARAELQVHRRWRFEEAGGAVEFDNEFSGARLNACERVGACEYRLLISPENEPINPSPWYAFRVSSAVEREVVVRLAVTVSKSRPWPWLSDDGRSWSRAASSDYAGGEGAADCVLRLRVAPAARWVASNRMVGIAEIDAWTDAVAARAAADVREVGRSAAGRPIRAFEFGAKDAGDVVVVIGRQHPPEVTGSLGLMRFVETLAADDARAREFRAHFRVLCVPLVNPDGVHEGQWRSTLGAVDANRDWGPFTQPETRCVRDAILAVSQRPGVRLRLLLDFHTTAKDILYVPPEATALEPPHFAQDWLAAIARRFPDYALDSSATNNVNEWTFKRWAFETFGAPGITYELGGATPSERIARTVAGAAEDAMQLLLDYARARDGAAAPSTSPSTSTSGR